MKALEDNEKLSSVFVFREDEFGSDALEFRKVIFQFQKHSIVLEPLPDTDEIKISEKEIDPLDVIGVAEESNLLFRDALGQQICQFWFCKNDKGYDDMVVFSFGHLLPNFAFLSIGSALMLFRFEAVLAGKYSGEVA